MKNSLDVYREKLREMLGGSLLPMNPKTRALLAAAVEIADAERYVPAEKFQEARNAAMRRYVEACAKLEGVTG